MSISAFIKLHPVATYYVLTLAISWGGLLIVAGPGGITTEQTTMPFIFVYLVTVAGPSVAGVSLTGLIHGRAGLREFRSRLLRWHVGTRWYAVALLIAPLSVMATLLALSLTSPVFLPGIITTSDKASLLLTGLVAGLVTGFLEELGWTGFAVPRLMSRYGLFTTGSSWAFFGERGIFFQITLEAPLPPEGCLWPSSCPRFSSPSSRPTGCLWCGFTIVPGASS